MKSSGPRFFSCFLWCFGDLATVETVWLEWLCNLADSPPTMPTIGMTWMILPKGWFFGGPTFAAWIFSRSFFLTTVIPCISPFHNGIPGIQTTNRNQQLTIGWWEANLYMQVCIDWKDRPVQLCSVIIGPIMPGVSRSMGHVWLWVKLRETSAQIMDKNACIIPWFYR